MVKFTQLLPQHVVPVTQQVTPPHVNEFEGHSHWHESLLSTNGGWQAGMHWPEAGQATLPLGQAQMPLKGSQKPLQHSESSRHFCSTLLHRPRASSSGRAGRGPLVRSGSQETPMDARATPSAVAPSRLSMSRRDPDAAMTFVSSSNACSISPSCRAAARRVRAAAISAARRGRIGVRPPRCRISLHQYGVTSCGRDGRAG